MPVRSDSPRFARQRVLEVDHELPAMGRSRPRSCCKRATSSGASRSLRASVATGSPGKTRNRKKLNDRTNNRVARACRLLRSRYRRDPCARPRRARSCGRAASFLQDAFVRSMDKLDTDPRHRDRLVLPRAAQRDHRSLPPARRRPSAARGVRAGRQLGAREDEELQRVVCTCVAQLAARSSPSTPTRSSASRSTACR